MSELDDKLISYGNLSHFYDKLKEEGIGGASLQEVTYAQLKALRDNSQLVPGQQYRITDFVTTCSDEAVGADESPARSVGYPFDIIVTADDVNKLNENARAINHPGVLIHNDIHYHEDYYEIYYDGYNDFPYAGTIEIDGTTYYKWGQNDGSYGGMFYLLTTESSYTNTVSGTDDCGDYWLTTYPIAGALSSDGETSVEFYERWTEKQKSIIETHEDNGTLYLRIADAFDACEEKLQEEYTSTDHFYKNDLNSWEIKYSLDNDGDRFSWALTEDKPGLGFAAIKVNTTKTENVTKLVLGDEIDCVGDNYEGDGHYYIDAGGFEYSYKGSITDNGTTYHIWYEPYKQNTVLTTQATYSNSVSGTNGNGCSYYDTVYDIVGEITIDGEEFQDLYKSAKKIIKTESSQEELEGSFLYKRYPAGDTANSYAWIYVKYSFDTNINDESVDWTNVDTNDIIYTTSLTPSIGTEISGSTIVEYSANVQEVVGKGVIYYMKDEWNNQMNYDFKNIQYETYGGDVWLYTFDDGNFVDSSLLGESNNNNFVSALEDARMYLYQYLGIYVKQTNIGGGAVYTAGSGISINNNQISCTYTYNLPTASSNTLGGVKVGSGLSMDSSQKLNVTLPTASSSTKGGVKVGDGLSINNEVLSTIITPDSLYKLLTNPNLLNPLTFEATEDNTEIIFKGTSKNIETSKDGENWIEYTATSTGTIIGTLNTNEQLFVRGTNASYSGSNFQFSKDTYVYGNIMSLIDKNNYPLIYEFGNYATQVFDSLFKDNIHLLSHQTKKLYLPATTLADNWCYNSMFRGCTSLTSAPELPAKTLKPNCYNSMFRGCTSLTTAPELPATTLADSCYNSMFEGCTSLTTAPELPATTLAYQCYQEMFSGCTSLTTTPELPATTLTSGCYNSMFEGCTSLTSAPELPATTLANYCYGYMFYGCTSLTSAPELPATTLTTDCYQMMFKGCTSLNYVKSLATDISVGNCTYDWLANVSSTGTFVTPQSTNWTSGPQGIPSGWTRVDA